MCFKVARARGGSVYTLTAEVLESNFLPSRDVAPVILQVEITST
jgi:hypothetical protein